MVLHGLESLALSMEGGFAFHSLCCTSPCIKDVAQVNWKRAPMSLLIVISLHFSLGLASYGKTNRR